MNIYVGNLAYSVGEESLRSEFEKHGEVSSVKLIVDHETQRSKGFGFVDMPNDAEAQAAITAMDTVELEGRALKVNQAKPRPERSSNANRY